MHEEVGRTIAYQEILGNKLRMVQYTIKENTTFFIFTFTAGADELDDYIDDYDRAIGNLIFK